MLYAARQHHAVYGAYALGAQFQHQPATTTPAGTGVTYQGRPLVNPGGNQPLYFAAPGSPVQPEAVLGFEELPLLPGLKPGAHLCTGTSTTWQ